LKQTRMVDYITETVMNEQLASNPSVEWTAESWGIQIENVFTFFVFWLLYLPTFPPPLTSTVGQHIIDMVYFNH